MKPQFTVLASLGISVGIIYFVHYSQNAERKVGMQMEQVSLIFFFFIACTENEGRCTEGHGAADQERERGKTRTVDRTANKRKVDEASRNTTPNFQ